MKPLAAARWLRIAMMAVFGFMSLGHGPVMTFAHATGSTHSASHASGHSGYANAGHDHANHETDRVSEAENQRHHTASHHLTTGCHDPSPTANGGCNAFGCFITVGPALVTAPALASAVLGKLLPLPPEAIGAVPLEPADPPPRLHG